MKIVTVSIPDLPSYRILVGEGALARMGEVIPFAAYSKVAVLTDSVLSELWLGKVRALLPAGTVSIIVPPGESSKEVGTLAQLWAKFAEAKLDRKSLLINLGGGAIGDLGGFAASTYMRGIDFANIPTSLLAQVDASVGGKTGIDHAGIKNLVGSFAQPIAVVAETATLSTLPQRELLSGFAEVIKHALIADSAYLDLLLSKELEDFEDSELSSIILRSIEIKKSIVESDVEEQGPRKLLNFGHTVGHAIEALCLESEVPLLHGEAISLGMLVEAELSRIVGLIGEREVDTVLKVIAHYQLPQRAPALLSAERIIDRMLLDKKNVAGKIICTLLSAIGTGKFDCQVAREDLQKALAGLAA